MRAWRTGVAMVTAVAATVLVGWVSVASASAAAPYCGITWGSLPKQVSSTGSGPPPEVTGVRAGQHACYDRLVIDVSGPGGPYWVEYVDFVKRDGAGFIVPLEGGAKLQIVTSRNAAGYPTGNAAWLADVIGYRTFRQVAWGGEFEGHSTIGLGVRARLPFRALVLDGPGSGTRLVVDVAHRW